MSNKRQLQENNIELNEVKTDFETFSNYNDIAADITEQNNIIKDFFSEIEIDYAKQTGENNKIQLEINNINLQKLKPYFFADETMEV